MNTRGKALRVDTVDEEEEGDDGLDTLRGLMEELNETGGTPTSVGGAARSRETVDSALSAESDSFSFVAESVEGGASRGSKSGGGKNCYLVVLQTEDGVGRCMGCRGKLKICWNELHDCPHPSHQVNGKASPAWGEICLMVEDGKAVDGEWHLSVSKLLTTDNLEAVLDWRSSAKDLKQWMSVRKAGQTPTGSRAGSSWTEADLVSKGNVAQLDNNPRTKSDSLKEVKPEPKARQKGDSLPSLEYNDVQDPAVKSSLQLLHTHLCDLPIS